jgi:outer membrane protein assembly factor BamB
VTRRVAALTLLAILASCGGDDVDNNTGVRSEQAVAYQGDAAHSGRTGVTAPAFPASAAWSRTFADPLSYPLIAGGRVFVVERGGQGAGHPSRLHALDRDTGAVVWGPVDLPGTFPAAGHAFDRGTVFVATFEGLLLSFDAATGRPGWSTQLPSAYGFVTAPTASEGIVLVSDGGGNRVVALDAATGAIVWSTPVNGGGTSIPAVTNGVVLLANPCQYYGLDAKTGAERWHYNGGCSGGGGATVAVTAGTAYVRDVDIGGSNSPVVDRRDVLTGTSQGRWTPVGLLTQMPLPALTTDAAFVLEGATLRRYDSAFTKAAWSFAADGSLTTAPIVLDNAVVVAGSNAAVYAVDATSGAMRWSSPLPSPIDAGNDTFGTTPVSGLAAGEGVLVVPARNTLTTFRLR